MNTVAELSGQRIDKWLWCARLFKTRTLAARTVAERSVRLTRGADTVRIEKPSAIVKPGDRIAYLSGERLRIIEVRACAVRRGPAPEARALYEDHTPSAPSPRERPHAQRARGAGRPTKKDRRAIDGLAARGDAHGDDLAF